MKIIKIFCIVISFYFCYLLADYLDSNYIYLPEKVNNVISDYQSPPKVSSTKNKKQNNQIQEIFVEKNIENKSNKGDYRKIIKIILLFFIFLSLFLAIKKLISLYLNRNIKNSNMKSVLKSLSKAEYYIFDDITLNFDNKKSLANHIIISQFGIFVIKTNKTKGKILADILRPKWSKLNNKIRRKFNNPIMENNKNILALNNCLDFLPIKSIENMVVFVEKCEFITEKPCSAVLKNELIGKIIKKKKRVISHDNMLKTIGVIERDRYINKEKVIKNTEFIKINPTS